MKRLSRDERCIALNYSRFYSLLAETVVSGALRYCGDKVASGFRCVVFELGIIHGLLDLDTLAPVDRPFEFIAETVQEIADLPASLEVLTGE